MRNPQSELKSFNHKLKQNQPTSDLRSPHSTTSQHDHSHRLPINRIAPLKNTTQSHRILSRLSTHIQPLAHHWNSINRNQKSTSRFTSRTLKLAHELYCHLTVQERRKSAQYGQEDTSLLKSEGRWRRTGDATPWGTYRRSRDYGWRFLLRWSSWVPPLVSALVSQRPPEVGFSRLPTRRLASGMGNRASLECAVLVGSSRFDIKSERPETYWQAASSLGSSKLLLYCGTHYTFISIIPSSDEWGFIRSPVMPLAPLGLLSGVATCKSPSQLGGFAAHC